MKKTLLSLIILLACLSVSVPAVLNTSGCTENVFSSGSIVQCSPAPFNSITNCSNLFNYNLSETNGVWKTVLGTDIPPNTAQATWTQSSEKFSFRYLEAYSAGHPTPSSEKAPQNFTVDYYKDGAWHNAVTQTDFLNDSDTEECRESGDWLAAVNQPRCQRYEVNIADAESIRVNVTDVHAIGASSELIFSGIMGCGVPLESCDFPLLFCDNFNYGYSMINNDWLVYEYSDIINSSFSPIYNRLNLEQDNKFYAPFHETEPFPVSYRAFFDGAYNTHFESPVFSTEFTINVSKEGFSYAAYEKQHIPAYVLKFNASNITSKYMDAYYMSKSQPSVQYTNICNDCLEFNKTYDMKIITYFAARDDYPFNSSITYNHISVYADFVKLGDINTFLDNRTRYLMQYQIIKDDDNEFIIDDYYVMVGTDRYIDTSLEYFSQLFENRTGITDDSIGSGTGDLATAVETIWDDMGLRSVSSKIMTALFLMFILALFIIGACISKGVPINTVAIMVCEIFFMIFLVYIKLLPVWIPIVLALLGSGIAALVFKLTAG